MYFAGFECLCYHSRETKATKDYVGKPYSLAVAKPPTLLSTSLPHLSVPHLLVHLWHPTPPAPQARKAMSSHVRSALLSGHNKNRFYNLEIDLNTRGIIILQDCWKS